MNQADFDSGVRYWGTSNGPQNTFGLVPKFILDKNGAPYSVVAPAIVTSYEIFQQAGGTGIFLLFFDAATVPVDTTALNDSTGFLFAASLAASTSFGVHRVVHRYNAGCCIVASTSGTAVTRGTAAALFCVTYMAYAAG